MLLFCRASTAATIFRLIRKYSSELIIGFLLIVILYEFVEYNAWEYLLALPFAQFKYPLEINTMDVVDKILRGEPTGVEPVNSLRYPFISNCDRKCRTEEGGEEDVFLLILVKSRMENFERRQMIRRTWGNEFHVSHVHVRRVFLLGVKPSGKQLQHRIGLEAREYEDLVQQYFVDAYENNTLKLVMGFQWATEYCRGAKFLAFLDDDYYVSTHNVVRLLQKVSPTETQALMIGFIWSNAMPFRHRRSKWYVSLEQYPYRVWPSYPTAGSFLVPMETAQRMYAAMPYVRSIRFDDVYIGIIAYKMRIKLRHSANILAYREPYDRHKFKDVLAAHGYDDIEELYKIWNDQNEYRKQREMKIAASR